MRKVFAVFMLCFAAPLAAQEKAELPPELEHEEKLIFASTRVGSWSGIAMRRLGSEYGANSIHCAIVTKDVVLMQTRAQESFQFGSTLSFLSRSQNELQIVLTGISVGRESYEMTRLPWRLIRHAEPGEIVTSHDISIPAFRKNKKYQWLPVSYLSDDMMDADKFTVFYTYETGEESPTGDQVRRAGKRTFRLNGFKEVSKWCGKQLLVDRLDREGRIKALVE